MGAERGAGRDFRMMEIAPGIVVDAVGLGL